MPWNSSATLLSPLAPWFERVKRQLPWRAEGLDGPHPNPYAVLVSELMLQQTQVVTVIPYFDRWMARFPDVHSLSMADDQTTHKLWEGLGYYRRCRFLKASATDIDKNGWPSHLDGLKALPGLGPYTSAALGAIAFQWATPALDGNAFRVLARLLLLEGDPKRQATALRDWMTPALEEHGPSRITQAIMELGATICTPQPHCEVCPLVQACAAKKADRTSEIPPVSARARVKEQSLWLVAVEADGSYLLHTPSHKGLLAGLWRWPSVDFQVKGNAVAEPQHSFSTLEMDAWGGWTQIYSHRKEVVNPLRLRVPRPFQAPPGMIWVESEDLKKLPLGRRDSRLRDLLAKPSAAPLGVPPGLLDSLRSWKLEP